MSANKRIPVTEERWKELNELKQAGQTYDELLECLIAEHKKERLRRMVEGKRESGTFTEVDTDEW